MLPISIMPCEECKPTNLVITSRLGLAHISLGFLTPTLFGILLFVTIHRLVDE